MVASSGISGFFLRLMSVLASLVLTVVGLSSGENEITSSSSSLSSELAPGTDRGDIPHVGLVAFPAAGDHTTILDTPESVRAVLAQGLELVDSPGDGFVSVTTPHTGDSDGTVAYVEGLWCSGVRRGLAIADTGTLTPFAVPQSLPDSACAPAPAYENARTVLGRLFDTDHPMTLRIAQRTPTAPGSSTVYVVGNGEVAAEFVAVPAATAARWRQAATRIEQ